MNSNRYTTSKYKYTAIKDEDIKSILAIKPPFDIYTVAAKLQKSHVILSRENALLRGSRKGFKVFIYKNEVAAKQSWFSL